MSNQFDSANYPETEPDQLTAGDRWAWKRTDLGADYDPASYALTYSCRLEGASGTGSVEITATASESGTDYIVEVAAATTAGYTVGVYHWQAYITRTSDGERVTVDSGTFEVKPDRANDTSDPRSIIKQTLDALEAMMLKKASKDQMSYSMPNGVSIGRLPPGELITWLNHYRSLYRNELQAEKIANGESLGNSIRVRF